MKMRSRNLFPITSLSTDRLLGLEDEQFRDRYKPELFIEELRAQDMFDLLIGTSTGSILSFGMGYKGLSPQECRDVYLKSIKNIFSAKYDKSNTGKVGLGDTLFRTIGDLVGQGKRHSTRAIILDLKLGG